MNARSTDRAKPFQSYFFMLCNGAKNASSKFKKETVVFKSPEITLSVMSSGLQIPSQPEWNKQSPKAARISEYLIYSIFQYWFISIIPTWSGMVGSVCIKELLITAV